MDQQSTRLDATRWTRLWSRLGARVDGIPVFRQLAASYSEPTRFYHNTAHLQHCLAELDRDQALAFHPDEVEAALWFHDAVYDPRRTDNEERSARLAETALHEAGVQREAARRVATLVLATRHTASGRDQDEKLVCDVDLAILGSQPAAFADFEHRIRQEYSWVPAVLYRRSRSDVLRRFLLRSSIYQTAEFRARYEEQARQNLERALAKLAE